MGLLKGIIDSSYTKMNRNRIKKIVSRVNDFSDWSSRLEDKSAFLTCTNNFRERLRNGETIYDIQAEALSVVREAIKRVTGMYPYDVQIEASIAMNEHVVAEMKTGEGKTLVQMLVAYLNLLEATKSEDKRNWTNVHIMTANDALAKRDATSNRKVFELLGFTCGFVPSRKSTIGYTLEQYEEFKRSKRRAYNCDVVYATATTIAFDYLEDNTIFDIRERFINKPFGYAIIDESDDLLIDQAINPLRLSGELSSYDSGYQTKLKEQEELNRYAYEWATEFLYDNNLTGDVYDQYERNKYEFIDKDYIYYLDTNDVFFSKRIIDYIYSGLDAFDDSGSIYSLKYAALVDCVRAKHSYIRDVQYKVDIEDGVGRIVLIDSNTGRKKSSNKYNDGMQEAIEAKEEYFADDYTIEPTNRTMTKAMCTYPDFISLYKGHISGMTGTSDISEFLELYGVNTYEVDTRLPNIREDLTDRVYATSSQKYNALIKEIIETHNKNQPILIGTTSDRESEILSSLLRKYNIKHNVLNSTHEEEENEIIAHAGELGSVTVSTNMAGRGVDIKLGPGVKELGGLYVIGTSINKSLRIDYQLRGRAGRQGDPGKSVFYVSLEDDLIRQYCPKDILSELIQKYDKDDGRIESKDVLDFVRKSQTYKEGYDKQTRRISEERNKVFTKHKEVIYDMRSKLLTTIMPKDFLNRISKIIKTYTNVIVENETPERINKLLGHLIDANSCYDSNKFRYAYNLNKAICIKLDESINGITGIDALNHINMLRIKILTIIDEYWADYIDLFRNIVNRGSEKYEIEADREFSYNLMPSIMNEIITYVAYPKLNYGDYTINRDKEIEDKKIIP